MFLEFYFLFPSFMTGVGKLCREPDSSLGFRYISLLWVFSLTTFEKYKNHFSSQVEQKLLEGCIGPHSYAAGVPS